MLEGKLKVGCYVINTDRGVKQDGLTTKIADYVNENNLDIFMAPEWLFLPSDRLYSKEEKDTIVHEIAEKTAANDALIIPGSFMWEDDEFFYNTAPVISEGNVICEVYKYVTGGSHGKAEARDCLKNWFADSINRWVDFSSDYQPTFTWRDYFCGLEICADSGILKGRIDEEFDLQFLTSCGVTFYVDEVDLKKYKQYNIKRYFNVREGGVCINSNGNKIVSRGAQVVKRKTLKNPNMKRKFDIIYKNEGKKHCFEPGSLAIFEVDINEGRSLHTTHK